MNKILTRNDIKSLKSIGIPVIGERNYWFLRTQGGKYFQEFYFEKYIAIEWNKLNNLDYITKNDYDIISGKISELYPDNKKPGYTAKQIKRFVSEMASGDIILIPSENSDKIAFGILEGEIYLQEKKQIDNLFESILEDDIDDKIEHLIKRRKVKWIDVVNRERLDPYLYRIIYSHSTIVNAKPYEVFIDRALHPIYIKNELAYITYRVNKTEDVSGYELCKFINGNLEIADKFIKKNNLSDDIKKIQAKINVQCPGDIQIIGGIFIIFVIACVSTIILGGEVSFLGLKFKTDGLSDKIKEWVELIHSYKIEKNIEDGLKESSKTLKISINKNNYIGIREKEIEISNEVSMDRDKTIENNEK